MEWIFAVMLVLQSLGAAAEQPAVADMIRQLEAEEAMYVDGQIAQAELAKGVFPAVTYPGDAVIIRSHEGGEVDWSGTTYSLLPYGANYYALLPIPRDMEPGTYTVDGLALEIKAKTFAESRLTVTEEQASMHSETERIQADQRKINEARSRSKEEFLYTGPFIQPVEGRLTTPYGFTRYVNGRLNGTHNAVDWAAPTGTPIQATNDGIVVLAEELYLTGFSVYIDHGMNLYSQYAHLSEILVEPGEEVEAGQIIGLVGSTGFSTGPHLHFTFWIGNNPANPDLFLNQTPFDWIVAE